ncbi:MAG: ATP-binding cassette domain-containing protein [Clostridiales bacterium]|nr:ATP-binding cassette domain-containing protein [Clostridiales bacterium]
MIELKNISKTYNHNNQSQIILDNISHVFKEGSNTSVLGESGCGKTTLLNLIGGIDLEFEGELLFRGRPIIDFDKFRRENVSFMFQDLNLLNHLNLIKNITVSLTNDVKNKEEKAIEILRRVGLFDHRDKMPHQLSGGERQRVAIARALARETDILLCDEPTGSLDDETKKEIMDLIMDVFRDKTIILVTHDEEIAQNYTDVILKFDDNGIDHQVKRTSTLKSTSKKKSIINRTFDKRFEFNLLSRKFSLFNSSYLIIIIAALFLFGTGIIKGIQTEVDKYYIDTYKVDKIDVRTSRFTLDGFTKFVDNYNTQNESQIIGFMAALEMNTSFSSDDVSYKKILRNIQPKLKDTFQSDIVVGRFPQSNNEILYSKGSALLSLFDYYLETIDDDTELAQSHAELLQLSDEEILSKLKGIEISYKNTYRYNPENLYDKDLEIVGLIDDYKYEDNIDLAFEYQDELITIAVNSNIYMLEDEFRDYVWNVYLGYYGIKFRHFNVFIEEENFDLRNEVFDGFLLHGFQVYGRDNITNERNDYHEKLHGYKVTLIAGCLFLLIFGAISIYNGIQSNIVRNKKNIGIYKSLGYSSKNIKTMFTIEGLIIALFTIVFSIMTWLIIKLIMNNYIVYALDPTDKFGFDNVSYLDPISLILVVVIIVSIIITSINQEFKKINIVNLIKHK